MSVNFLEKKQLLHGGVKKDELCISSVSSENLSAQEVIPPLIFGSEFTANANYSFFYANEEKKFFFTFTDLAEAKKNIKEQEKIIADLQKVRDELEQKVANRTSEIEQKNKKIEEMKIALNVLLQKNEEDAKQLGENVLFNVEKIISPYLEKLKLECNCASQIHVFEIIQSNLNKITSSFAPANKDYHPRLTPTQIQITNLIKQGHTTKEIASILHLSPSTISCHRQEIRRRLSLNNKKINLQAALTGTT